MMKKLILITIFCILLFSCGKKGDPEFKKKDGTIKKLMKVAE